MDEDENCLRTSADGKYLELLAEDGVTVMCAVPLWPEDNEADDEEECNG